VTYPVTKTEEAWREELGPNSLSLDFTPEA
jgi:hypothetical protein